MKFNEQFPSLNNRALTIDGKLFTVKMAHKDNVKTFRETEIQSYCLDKQKVRDAINKIEQTFKLSWDEHETIKMLIDKQIEQLEKYKDEINKKNN